MPETLNRSLSSVSLDSVPEDSWDRSLPDIKGDAATTTLGNSIAFPVNEISGNSLRYTHSKTTSAQVIGNGKGNRTLSDLLSSHSEKNSKGNFSAEEAARIADVLGQWVGVYPCSVLKIDPDAVYINASSSPYEAEDDFFVPSGQSMDDLSIILKRPSQVDCGHGRPRGRSKWTSRSNSRPSSMNVIPS